LLLGRKPPILHDGPDDYPSNRAGELRRLGFYFLSRRKVRLQSGRYLDDQSSRSDVDLNVHAEKGEEGHEEAIEKVPVLARCPLTEFWNA